MKRKMKEQKPHHTNPAEAASIGEEVYTVFDEEYAAEFIEGVDIVIPRHQKIAKNMDKMDSE